MLLKNIVTDILRENEEDGDISDAAVVAKTLDDTFEVSTRGLEYIQAKLGKMIKKANRIGVEPLKLDVVSEREVKYKDEVSKRELIRKLFTVKVSGKAPIIEGYEFIASVEHTQAGNIINVSPQASVKNLPEEYRTTTPTCDYCHTKRDRNNTFVLKNTETKELMKVGSGCLKNFLQGKNPAAILEYAEWLSSMLRVLVGAEGMSDDEGSDDERGFSGRSKYYDADSFLYYVCLAYTIEGRYVSKKALRDNPELDKIPTATLADTLMNLYYRDEDTIKSYEELIHRYETKAKALFEEVDAWKETKDWDAEAMKSPNMSDYFHNMKVLSKSPTIQIKNQGYHASLLAVYLREKVWNEKHAEKAKAALAPTGAPKTYVGKLNEKVTTKAVLKKYRKFQRPKYSYNDSGIGYMYLLHEEGTNNEILYFPTNPGLCEVDEGKTYKVVGTVKKQEPSKFNGVPQTILTRAKFTEIASTQAAGSGNIPSDVKASEPL